VENSVLDSEENGLDMTLKSSSTLERDGRFLEWSGRVECNLHSSLLKMPAMIF
jgi:hypothetical protein